MATFDRLHVSFSESALGTLEARVEGRVLLPEDAEFEAARKGFNLSFQHTPAVIVIAESAADIVAAVRFAAEQDLTIAIQGAGHGFIRTSENALLIITSRMQDVHIEPATQTAWIGAGVKWGTVLQAAQAHGLAPLLGSSPDVGVAGYTLGGGMGWLARHYGLATDSVIFFELVTAEGRLVRASAEENSDLFWALRGGGGNFGVLTGMEIKLYPVTEVYGGNLLYPIEQAKAVFTRYREWIKDAPDALTSSIAIMNFPPFPELPEFLRGKSFAIVRGCYSGPVQEGEHLMRFWRDWQAPAIDDWKVMPFSEVGLISNEPLDPAPVHVTGAWVRELTDELLDTLIARVPANGGASPITIAEIRHAGGAVARVDASASAYSHRDAPHLMEFVSMVPDPSLFFGTKAFVDQLKRELQPALTGGVYMNFMEGEEARARTRDGFSPEAYRRLTEIKAKYDPQNRFNHSFDIRPAKS